MVSHECLDLRSQKKTLMEKTKKSSVLEHDKYIKQIKQITKKVEEVCGLNGGGRGQKRKSKHLSRKKHTHKRSKVSRKKHTRNTRKEKISHKKRSKKH